MVANLETLKQMLGVEQHVATCMYMWTCEQKDHLAPPGVRCGAGGALPKEAESRIMESTPLSLVRVTAPHTEHPQGTSGDATQLRKIYSTSFDYQTVKRTLEPEHDVTDENDGDVCPNERKIHLKGLGLICMVPNGSL